MKRKGHIYERVTTWEMCKRAQIESSKNKPNSYGVQKHKKHWLKQLVELHEKAIKGDVKTSEYTHEWVVSGQDKLRDIAKLYYYPDNIWHQMLVLASDEEISKTFIKHTYANQKGKGQIAALKIVQEWIKEDPKGTAWCAKGDICHYYASIPHKLIRQELERTFKDKRYVEAYLEPISDYCTEGKPDTGIPIGTRPSQTFGNLSLRSFHRFVKEVLRVMKFLMYLDDFWIFGRTKGEVKRNYKRAEKFLNRLGFELHAPVFVETKKGVDGLGFVTYENGKSYWRRKNKCRWLRHRAKVTNKRRLRELDAAAWGALKHGCEDCQKLFKMITATDLGIEIPAATDKDGRKIIDFPRIGMQMLLDNEVVVFDYVENVKTTHGEGRLAIAIEWNGKKYKTISNSQRIKTFVTAFGKKNVNRYIAKFVNLGGNNYDIKLVDVKQINGRDLIKNEKNEIVYADTNEKVQL